MFFSDRGTSIESDAARRVRDSFHRAFWDSLVVDLEMSPPCYVRVLRVLIEVRDGIVEAAPASEAARACEVIDMELIKQQADAGLCTWGSCRALVASVVALVKRALGPRREVETSERWAELENGEGPRAVCLGLEFLLDRVNALRIDAANARLRTIAPVIRDSGIDYERERFEEKLNAGTLTLERAKAWLETSRVAGGVGLSHNDIFVNAMVGLVASDEPLRKEACPETLLMDVNRIQRFQEEFDHVVKSGALLARSVPIVGRDKVVLIAAALATTRDISQAVETVLGADVTQQMRIALEQTADRRDVVCGLMRTRVCAAIKSGVASGFHESVTPLVSQLVAKVNKLIRLNRAVHAPTYDRILRGEIAGA